MKYKLDDYYVGELAKFYGVSHDTIRVYDRKDILSPIKNIENNYRLYTKEDFISMDYVMRMRRLDLPLDKIRQIRKSGDICETHRILSEHESELENIIQALSQRQHELHFYHEKIKACVNNLGKVEIVYSSPFIVKKIKDTMAETMAAFDLLNNMGSITMPMLAVPSLTNSYFFSDIQKYIEIITDREKRQQECDYLVLMEDINHISDLSEFPKNDFIVIPPSYYARAYIAVQTNKDYSQVAAIIKQIDEMHLKFESPSFTIFLSDSCNCTEELEYLEVWLRINHSE